MRNAWDQLFGGGVQTLGLLIFTLAMMNPPGQRVVVGSNRETLTRLGGRLEPIRLGLRTECVV
jgi:hypothetical protein